MKLEELKYLGGGIDGIAIPTKEEIATFKQYLDMRNLAVNEKML